MPRIHRYIQICLIERPNPFWSIVTERKDSIYKTYYLFIRSIRNNLLLALVYIVGMFTNTNTQTRNIRIFYSLIIFNFDTFYYIISFFLYWLIVMSLIEISKSENIHITCSYHDGHLLTDDYLFCNWCLFHTCSNRYTT